MTPSPVAVGFQTPPANSAGLWRSSMRAPHELQAAQGFPATYDMTDAGRLTKTAQVRLIGNSVCPPIAAAIIRAQFPTAFISKVAA